MSENVELVCRWYAFLPRLQDVDPDEDPAFVDRAFRDFLGDEYEIRLPSGYAEGEPVFTGRGGLAQMVAMLRDAWSAWRFDTERSSTRGAGW